MVICGSCGTENRDKARYCIGCARPLEPVELSAGSKGARKTKLVGPVVGSAKGDAEGTSAMPAWRWMVALTLGVAALGLGMRWWSPSEPSVAPPPSPGQATSQSVLPALTNQMANVVAPAHSEDLAESLEKGEELVEAPKAVMEQRVVAQRDKKAPVQAMGMLQRQRADDALQASQAANASDLADVAAADGASSVVPKPEMSVERACAQTTTNVVSRDLCRIDLCERPSKAGDPICIWFRKLEAERRSKITF